MAWSWSLLPFLLKDKAETYAEYVERKREKATKGYGFLLICGVVFLAVAAAFAVLYSQTYG